MRRFPDRHHPQFVEFAQINRRAIAEQPGSLAPQFPLHGRRDIDRSQGLEENEAGEFFQFRHRTAAEDTSIRIPPAQTPVISNEAERGEESLFMYFTGETSTRPLTCL